MRLRRIPRDRRPDLTGVEMLVANPALLERDGQLDPDRAGADEQDVCLDHCSVLSPSETSRSHLPVSHA